jgi:hypothetical protein
MHIGRKVVGKLDRRRLSGPSISGLKRCYSKRGTIAVVRDDDVWDRLA